MRIPAFLRPVGRIYAEAGYQCYLVGGAVRNTLIGIPPKDYDLATDARPEATKKLFSRVIPTGIAHGTVTILFRGHHLEVTTFRKDQEYSDGRRPDSVEYAGKIEDDLSRRDFTINALALDVVSGAFVDLFDGVQDAREGVVRAIGEPRERFQEDGLRLMRAVRFACQFGFSIDVETFDAMRRERERISVVSWERIRDEFEKIVLSEKPSTGLELLRQAELLRHVVPELMDCVGVAQTGGKDVYEHSLLSCDGAPQSLVLRLAALFHDLGKARTVVVHSSGELSFHQHEQVSAELTAQILARLRFPNDVSRYVSHLVRHHMFHYSDDWSDAAVRRFLSRVGLEAVDDLLVLREADTYGKVGRHAQSTAAFHKRIEAVLEGEHALTVKDLAINGNDLNAAARIPKGPEMGVVLGFLLESVLDDPSQNRFDTLVEIGARFYRSRVKPTE